MKNGKFSSVAELTVVSGYVIAKCFSDGAPTLYLTYFDLHRGYRSTTELLRASVFLSLDAAVAHAKGATDDCNLYRFEPVELSQVAALSYSLAFPEVKATVVEKGQARSLAKVTAEARRLSKAIEAGSKRALAKARGDAEQTKGLIKQMRKSLRAAAR